MAKKLANPSAWAPIPQAQSSMSKVAGVSAGDQQVQYPCLPMNRPIPIFKDQVVVVRQRFIEVKDLIPHRLDACLSRAGYEQRKEGKFNSSKTGFPVTSSVYQMIMGQITGNATFQEQCVGLPLQPCRK